MRYAERGCFRKISGFYSQRVITGINYESEKRSGPGGDKVPLDVVGHINRKCLSRELLEKILVDFLRLKVILLFNSMEGV